MLTVAELPTYDLDGETLVLPDFAGRGLASIAPTILQLLTPSVVSALPPLSPAVLPDSLTQDVTTVVLVVADGLGHLQLMSEVALGNAPNLGQLIDRASSADDGITYSPITSVFPTTTVAALGSINSGVTPAEHGLLAYQLYLEEFQTVAEMIRWGPVGRRGTFSDPEFGAEPEAFFWAPTLYDRLRGGGLERAFAVNPGHFQGTALTRMMHQQATYAGYIATSSLEPIISRVLAESDDPTYVYAYWPTVDTIAHLVGPLTAEHSAEVAAFDFQFGRLVRRLTGRERTLILLTADHGHVDTEPDQAVLLADHPELMAMLRVPPAGERRVVYLYARPGAAADIIAYCWERLRSAAPPMSRERAIELGLFGPGRISERALARIGEVLLFPRGSRQLVAPVETVEGSAQTRVPVFKGLHGGLTPDEALVPLLALRV
jgi:hypothetical protein